MLYNIVIYISPHHKKFFLVVETSIFHSMLTICCTLFKSKNKKNNNWTLCHFSVENPLNPLWYGKNSVNVITSCRCSRPTNIANHRAAWHLSIRVTTFRHLCDWPTYAWSVKEAGIVANFRYIFPNSFAIILMNLKLFLILWNGSAGWGLKKE